MKTLIAIGTIVGPFAFVLLRWTSAKLRTALDALGVVSAFGFGLLSAFAVADIRAHGTVYATEVHKLFDNPAFLAFAGYLGLYMLYRLLWSAFASFREGAR
ncbi:transposase [Paenibacillus flagellatus]|uniref:Transposase n=1 Tax=Paenibacillus flagellatus TaxID=2211139 RepID=A0A2V5KSN9_9BACL|nr:transposase [Paenibacillus flagellatus]PYI52076.1 transposase [Paenibacillus flagellatus]